jgi:glutathione peroxidase
MNALRRRVRLAQSAEPALTTAHDFSFRKLNGEGEIPLRDFAGKAILIVNVASQCGFTPQYRELQALWEAKQKSGLIVLGVPSNDFGNQEQGGEDEIAAFVDKTYHVTFPMTAKVEIVGADRHPFYEWIAKEMGPDALPRWNFHKFLIGKDGALEGSFSSKAAPLGAEIISAIEKALAA